MFWRLSILLALAAVSAPAVAAPLPTAPVQRMGGSSVQVAEGVVEPVRQTVIAPQVSGRITALKVQAGDVVAAGQVLATIDARTAAQQVAASQAQVSAGRAQLVAARNDYERNRQLREKGFISVAALDQARMQYDAARAQLDALAAQAEVAGTQTGFHTLRAPYAAVIAEVSVELGDMAMPGKPLFAAYDPTRLRVVATVPQGAAARLRPGQPVRIELPGLAGEQRWQTARSVTVLPTANAASHTVQVRLELPSPIPGIAPGQFARALLPLEDSGKGTLSVPARALVKRSELTAVYVLDTQGRPRLRQIRPGKPMGPDRVEVLAGVQEGEQVVLDPLLAARRSEP